MLQITYNMIAGNGLCAINLEKACSIAFWKVEGKWYKVSVDDQTHTVHETSLILSLDANGKTERTTIKEMVEFEHQSNIMEFDSVFPVLAMDYIRENPNIGFMEYVKRSYMTHIQKNTIDAIERL